MNDNQNTKSEDQIGELIDTYTALDQQPPPMKSVELETDLRQSMIKFFEHYLDRIQNHEEFETILKQVLLERLSEASIEEIINILNIVMTKSNSAVEKIMIPFTGGGKPGANGDVTNNLFVGLTKKQSIEEKMIKDESMTQDTMKGLYELAQLMNSIMQDSEK